MTSDARADFVNLRGDLSTWLTAALSGNGGIDDADLLALRDWVDEQACTGPMPMPRREPHE